MPTEYCELSSRGIALFDMPSDSVPKKVMSTVIIQSHQSFSSLFDEYVLRRNNELLEHVFNDVCNGNAEAYSRLCVHIILTNDDLRSVKASIKELQLYQDRVLNNVHMIPFPELSSRHRVPLGNDKSPMRISMSVLDKLSLRVGAGYYKIPVWQYVSELLTDGMLNMFITAYTTPDEKTLLYSPEQATLPKDLVDEASSIIYSRVVAQYHKTISVSDVKIRPGRNRLCNPDEYWQSITPPISDFTLPTPIPPAKTLIPVHGDAVLDEETVRNIIAGNDARYSRIVDQTISDPMIKDSIEQFREVVFKQYAAKEWKIAESWRQLSAIIQTQIECLAAINKKQIDSLDITDRACRAVFSTLVDTGILSKTDGETVDIDNELLKKMQYAIDDATSSGGVTKSQLRVRVGRNHPRYLPMVEDILHKLVVSRRYELNNGRYIAIGEDAYTTRMVPTPKRGRPSKADAAEVVQYVDGRLSDYLPPLKKKKEEPPKGE